MGRKVFFYSLIFGFVLLVSVAETARAGAKTDSLSLSGSTMSVKTSGGVVISSFNATGSIVEPLAPCFLAQISSNKTNVTGDGTEYVIIFDSEIYDQGNNYNPANGTFTAPVGGRYILSANFGISDLNSAVHTAWELTLVTSNRSYVQTYQAIPSGVTFMPVSFTVVADMDAGDTANVHIIVSGSSKVVDIGTTAARTSFSGALIH